MVEQLAISERRACRLAGLSRTSLRRSADTPEDSQELRERIRELAYRHKRYGYRRIHDLLRIQGLVVNHKRIWRLYREQNLAVRKRRKAKRPDSVRVPRPQAVAINEVWSMGFVSDSLANGRRIKCLTVVDDFSREAVDIAVTTVFRGRMSSGFWIRRPVFAVIRKRFEPIRGRSLPAGLSWPGLMLTALSIC